MPETYTGRVAATVIPRTEEKRYFLAAKRNDSGEWEFPGGKQHVDEDLLTAAEREIKEEFSLEVKSIEAKPEDQWQGGGYDIVPVYATHDYTDLDKEIERKNMTDHAEHVWLDTQNLGSNLENPREELDDEIRGLEAFDFI